MSNKEILKSGQNAELYVGSKTKTDDFVFGVNTKNAPVVFDANIGALKMPQHDVATASGAVKFNATPNTSFMAGAGQILGDRHSTNFSAGVNHKLSDNISATASHTVFPSIGAHTSSIGVSRSFHNDSGFVSAHASRSNFGGSSFGVGFGLRF
jgi:hypothetical protein